MYTNPYFHCESPDVLCYCCSCQAGSITVCHTNESACSARKEATRVDELFIIVDTLLFPGVSSNLAHLQHSQLFIQPQ